MSVVCIKPLFCTCNLFSQMSDLLKALPQRKPPSCKIAQTDPRNRANLSVLKHTEKGRGTFRSRAVLPKNIKQLSNCQFKRRDYLRESLSASVPVPPPITAECSSQEGTLQSSNPVIPAHLVDESKILPFDSSPSVAEQLKKQETHLCILGVQAWTSHSLCEQQRPLKPSPQNG